MSQTKALRIINATMRFQLKATKLLLSLRLGENSFLYILAALIGIGGGFGAVLFRWLIGMTHFLFLEKGQIFLGTDKNFPWLLPLIPALGGLCVGLMTYFLAREAKGHGVPEVMAAVVENGGVIRPRVVIIKALASAICIGSGGAVGREGPIVQIGSAFGSSIGQFFHIPRHKLRILVGCGAAAGISATFNAPIAGLMFALEVILGEFAIHIFTPIIISSVLAAVTTQMILGDEIAFSVPAYQLVHPIELVNYIILGSILGVIAVVFTRMLYKAEDLFDEIPIPEYLKPVIGGLIIGAMGIFAPRSINSDPAFFGVGYEAITNALINNLPLLMLSLYFVAKLVATLLTLGSGGSGGIFAPSLFMGAMIGGVLGHGAHTLFPNLTASPGAYALVGMAAMVGGTTHAPLAAMLIIFEMTRDYAIILPLMLATGISTVVASLIDGESIYTLKLSRRGLRIRRDTDISILERIQVQEALAEKYDSVSVNTPMRDIVELFKDSQFHDLPVLDDDGGFVGMIHFRDIRPVMLNPNIYSLIIANDLLGHDEITVTPSDTLAEALMKFSIGDVSELPVVDEINPNKIVGVLSRISLMHRYQQELLAHRKS
ncbi:chloride channel protein [bacterium]|nr:chloride channel protein [bacterium]